MVAAAPDLSIVVLSWNTRELTLACLRALQRDRSRRARQIVVVDNGSEDGSADAIEALGMDEVVLLRNADNRGYAGGNNQGAAAATGRWLCLLNSDTEVQPGALDLLVDHLEQHPSYGAAAPKLCNPDGSVQRACMRFPGLAVALVYDSFLAAFPPGKWVDNRYYMRDFDHLHSRDVDQPPGACMIMDRAEYQAMGGLDQQLWLFFNDVDLCRRLWRSGRRIRYLAEAEVIHHGGASTKNFGRFVVIWFRNRIAYYRKHYGWFGALYLRGVLRMRAMEEWWKAGRTHRDPAARQAARAEIRTMVAEILAP